ncbi:MAG: hypothetical protein HY721_09385, partial [Planctomycetes bacterium]|nr:hypothetical protein [Planctomycetota bacterium]
MLKPLPPARERAFAGLLRTDLGELASLKHPCLASPVRLCREGGQTYLARPYVEGTDVLAASRGKGERWLVGVLSSAARALALLHRFGLAHGNLKSANLLVRRRPPPTSDEATPAVALSDPAWWPSPGLAGAAHAADLRGLGAVGYSILTGRALDPSVEKALERPRKLSPAVSTDLERVILKLLQRDPRKGYESTDDLLADLGRLTGESLTGLLRPASCFLDREAELRRARALLDEARGPTAIAVTAEAGMGKSA